MSTTPSTPSSGVSSDEYSASSSTAVSVGTSAKLLINARLVGVDTECDAILSREGVVEWIGKETEAPFGEYEIVNVQEQWVAPVRPSAYLFCGRF